MWKRDLQILTRDYGLTGQIQVGGGDTNRHTGWSVRFCTHENALFIGISGLLIQLNTNITEKTAENQENRKKIIQPAAAERVKNNHFHIFALIFRSFSLKSSTFAANSKT